MLSNNRFEDPLHAMRFIQVASPILDPYGYLEHPGSERICKVLCGPILPRHIGNAANS